MCSIAGAWLAPIPPITLAMCSSALSHLLADFRECRICHAGELDHHVDRHAALPEADPVALAHQLLLFVAQTELVHPRFLVARKELALLGVLQRVGRLIEADSAHSGVLVEQ